VFIIGPDRKIKASLSYPTVAGRYFPEIIRLVDALQLGSKYPIATPVGWQKGEDVMIQPSLSDADAAARFPGYRKVELPSGKGYVRMTADPSKTTA
jgi:alkyl hydroperoxide reductase subunit AhpC